MPEMLLRLHFLEGGVFFLPDRSDVEKHLRFPFALLGLMRLEEENRGRADDRDGGIVSMGLRDDARVLNEMSGERMIEIVGIVKRMGEDELGANFSVEGSEFEEHLIVDAHRVIADVEEDGVGTQDFCGAPGFRSSRGFDGVESHARLAPESCGFAAFAKRETDDGDGPAALGVERDGSAGAPDKVRGMSADNQCRFAFGHDDTFLWRVVRGQGTGGVPWV
jgi:hypothetical protein